jgi:long-chain acyl-CoA synthetase
MFLESFYEVFESVKSDCALIHKDDQVTYAQFVKNIKFWHERIEAEGIPVGQVVGLRGDFTPNSMAILFALIENQNIIVPFDYQQSTNHTDKYQIAKVQTLISVDDSDQVVFEELHWDGNSPLYDALHKKEHPGLVLFTSGTSGHPKAAVHDFVSLLAKFKKRTKTFRTLNFLLFDHWGGLNTMFHTLANAGTVLALKQRGSASVCAFIEKHKIELLPASPTFFNLLLISQEYLNYDLSSLKLITYGTEPMPESTLQKIKEVFPDVRLQQTYGLIELGVMRSRSKSDGSLWVQVGGEGYETRVVSGLLEIKAESAMLGYLNAKSPFTSDGWFRTGDMVEVDGDYIKIMGRKSELINVGGEKVYPTEVESVLKQLDNVITAVVYGEKHVITGNIVCAKILLDKAEEKRVFVKRLKSFCRGKMSSFKVPVKVELVTDLSELYSYRMKTKRV